MEVAERVKFKSLCEKLNDEDEQPGHCQTVYMVRCVKLNGLKPVVTEEIWDMPEDAYLTVEKERANCFEIVIIRFRACDGGYYDNLGQIYPMVD